MKKIIPLLVSALMLLILAACGSKTPKQDPNATRIFTDSTGREGEGPAQIDKVALSGPLAQIVLFALCPDKLVGVSNAWSSEAQEFLDEKYFNMPQIGQLYGGKGELNLETLLQSGAQVVIDVGESKGSIKEDMDASDTTYVRWSAVSNTRYRDSVKNSSAPEMPIERISTMTLSSFMRSPFTSDTGTMNGYAAANASVMPQKSQPAVL